MTAQDAERRPGRDGGVRPDDYDASTWATIRRGWAQSGHQMPRPGTRAFRALPRDDAVRHASLLADAAGLGEEVRRDGPSAARALLEVSVS